MNCSAAPPDIICSGRGICIGYDECQCEDGFSGISDFVLGSPSCSISIVAIQSLWGISAVLYVFLCLPSAILVFISKYKNFSKKRKYDAILINSWFLSVAIGTILPIYRTFNPLAAFGTDFFGSILLCIYLLFIHISTHTFARLFIKATSGQKSTSTERKKKLFLYFLPVSLFLQLVSSVVPVILMLVYPNLIQLLATIYFIGNHFAIVVLALLVVLLYVNPAIHDIRNGSDLLGPSAPVQLKKLYNMRKNFLSTAIFDIAAGLAFGLCPILARNASYFMAIINIQNVPFVLVFSVSLLSQHDLAKAKSMFVKYGNWISHPRSKTSHEPTLTIMKS